MPAYDYACQYCEDVAEVRHGMQEHPKVTCKNCGHRMTKIITEFPHTRLNWRMPSSRDDGHDRLTLHRARRGQPTPIDEWGGRP